MLSFPKENDSLDMETGPVQSARQALLGELLRLDTEAAPAFGRLVERLDEVTEDGSLALTARAILLSAEGRDLFLEGVANGRELAPTQLLERLVSPQSVGADGAESASSWPLEERLARLEEHVARTKTLRHRLLCRLADIGCAGALLGVGWILGGHLLKPLEVAAALLALLSLLTLRLALDPGLQGRRRAFAEMTSASAACAAIVFLGAGLANATMSSTWIALSDVASIGSVACSLYTLSRMR